MRILNETDKYLESLNTQTEEKEEKSTQDLLSNVSEVFSTLTSAVKDLEKVMIALQVSKTPETETTTPEEVE